MSDIKAYQMGIREQKRRQGAVTTMVTANENDEEEDRIEVPPNAITVESTHVREVFELGSARPSRSQGSLSEELHKTGSNSSDEFFRKY